LKGLALRHVCVILGVRLDATLVCGDPGNDRDMLVATGMAAIVANHAPELESLRGNTGVFFSRYPGPPASSMGCGIIASTSERPEPVG
jgi:phosphoserine phosphatase